MSRGTAAAAALGKWRRENPAWLTYAASGNIAFCMKTNTDMLTGDLDLWPIDRKIKGFPELIVEHLYIKFGDPIAASFWNIVWNKKKQNKQTDSGENPTPATVVNVGDETTHVRMHTMYLVRRRCPNDLSREASHVTTQVWTRWWLVGTMLLMQKYQSRCSWVRPVRSPWTRSPPRCCTHSYH